MTYTNAADDVNHKSPAGKAHYGGNSGTNVGQTTGTGR